MVSQACNPGSTQEVEPRVSRLSRLQGQLWQEPDPTAERFGALFLHSVTCYLYYSFPRSHFPSPGLVQSAFFSLYSQALWISPPHTLKTTITKTKNNFPLDEVFRWVVSLVYSLTYKKDERQFQQGSLCYTRGTDNRHWQAHSWSYCGTTSVFPSVKSSCHSLDSNSFSQNIRFLESSKTNHIVSKTNGNIAQFLCIQTLR